jgi:hypothetical protein
MTQANALYEAFASQLSLRGFTRLIGPPYWHLRDYRGRDAWRREVSQRHEDLTEPVKRVALEEPTYGYRGLWRVLKGQGVLVGRERLGQ